MEILEADLPGLLGRSAARDLRGDAFTRGRALARLAAAVSPSDPGRGRALLARGRDLALSGSFLEQDLVLTELARVAAENGDLAQAGELVLAHPDESRRATGLLKLMRITEPDGVLPLADEAEPLIRRLTAPDQAALSAAELAVLLAPRDPRRSRALVDHAEALLPPVVDPEQAAWILAVLANASAVLGDAARAFSFLDRSESRHVGHPEDRSTLLTELAEVAAAAGDRGLAALLLEEARTLLADTPDPYPRFLCSVELVRSARLIGDERTGRALLHEAGHTASTISDPHQQAPAWTELAKTASPEQAAAFAARARALLPSVRSPWSSLEILTRAPDADSARDLLSRFLPAEPWPVCLIAALLAFPDPSPGTLTSIADAVLVLTREQGR